MKESSYIENNIQYFQSLDSTQIEAKRQIDTYGIIVESSILSQEQTNGLTTKKNIQWRTSKDDLHISTIFHINTLLNKGNISVNHLPFCCSLAVLDTILEIKNDLQVLLKWPNDILIGMKNLEEKYDTADRTMNDKNTTSHYGDNVLTIDSCCSINYNNNLIYKKICGILCEIYKEHFIIGIGCNLVSHPKRTEHFLATDLLSETNKKVNPIKFAEDILQKMKDNILHLQQYGFEGIKNRWKAHAYMLNSILILRDNNRVLFKDITDDGYILAFTENGEKVVIISSDEVIGGYV